jgi:flagellar hook-length control protein FliK
MNSTALILPTDRPEGPGNGDRLRARAGEIPQGAFAAMLQGGTTAQAILAQIPVDFSQTLRWHDTREPAGAETAEATLPSESRRDGDTAVTDYPEAEAAAEYPHDPDVPFTSPAEAPVPAVPETSGRAADAPRQPAISRHATPAPQAEPAAPHPVTSQESPATYRALAQAEPHAPTPAQANKLAQDTGPRLAAQVTERPAELLSRPGATLAASTTLAAQTGLDKRGATGDMTDTGPRLAATLLRHAHAGGQTPNGQSQTGNPFAPGEQAAATAQQPPSAAAFGLLTAQAATAGRAGTLPGGQNPLSVSGGEIGSAGATDGPQAPYRAAGQARFLRGRPPVPPQALTRQVAVHVQKAVGQGVDRIQIQLKPADLGRIEIRLDVPADGRATIMISADRQETLDLLQRDARSLQTALQDTGLQADGESLKFSLRGGNAGGQEQTAAADHADAPDELEAQAGSAGAQPQILSDDQIDITV